MNECLQILRNSIAFRNFFFIRWLDFLKSCLFLTRFARGKTSQHDLKNQFLVMKNSYIREMSQSSINYWFYSNKFSSKIHDFQYEINYI